MNRLRTLYHIARADFLERARRYSCLITLGLTVIAAYVYLPPANANYLTLGLGNYRGLYNSAWVGGAVAVLCSALLSLPAFYLVKNAIERDDHTGVGQIIASTPLGKVPYVLGKAFSNFVFLALMVGVIALAAGATQLIRGEDFRIDLWALLSPFIICVLPAMAMISAVAVLFETIPWLRGTLGNVAYFIMWLVLLIVSAANMPSFKETSRAGNDLWGIQPILSSMIRGTAAAFPDFQGSVAIGAVTLQEPLRTYTWTGIHWTSGIIFGRLLWILPALGIGLLAALFFRRFDPAPRKPRAGRGAETSECSRAGCASPTSTPAPVHLTPLTSTRGAYYPIRILLAELRLLFKGSRWWWLALLMATNIAGFLLRAESTRRYLLPVMWILPLPLWSTLGTREGHHNTTQLVFSAPHPLRRQLLLTWLGGVAVAIVAGAGVAIRVILAGDWPHVLAWGVGSLFIPSLALALGVWSGSKKLFEVVYMLLWYAGPVNGMEALDFMGTSSVVTAQRLLGYALLTIVLLAFAILGRWRQIKR